MNRTELENHPQRIDRTAIKKGDLIEQFTPKMVDSGTFPPYKKDPTGEMTSTGIRIACSNTMDLAGRWTSSDGELIHGEHGGCEDAPGLSGWEFLIKRN